MSGLDVFAWIVLFILVASTAAVFFIGALVATPAARWRRRRPAA
jgi:hypothetical protein